MPCAVGAFLQESSEFCHHSHQTSFCAVEGTVLLKTVQLFFRGSLNLK